MDYQNKYIKYKQKYLKLKTQIGGNSMDCDNMRMIQNCDLCFSNVIIHLFYSIPEFRNAIITLQSLDNTYNVPYATPTRYSDNFLFFMKNLFYHMDRKNRILPEFANDNYVLCTEDSKFHRIYTFFIDDYQSSASQILNVPYNGHLCSVNQSLYYFTIIFSDILDKLFCYILHPISCEKNYLIDNDYKDIKLNKYMICHPDRKEDCSDEYDYINIKNYEKNINGTFYELIAIISGVYLSKEGAIDAGDGFCEGPYGHFWLDVYDKSTGKYTMINDVEPKIETNYDRNKNKALDNKPPANAWLIYEKC